MGIWRHRSCMSQGGKGPLTDDGAEIQSWCSEGPCILAVLGTPTSHVSTAGLLRSCWAPREALCGWKRFPGVSCTYTVWKPARLVLDHSGDIPGLAGSNTIDVTPRRYFRDLGSSALGKELAGLPSHLQTLGGSAS